MRKAAAILVVVLFCVFAVIRGISTVADPAGVAPPVTETPETPETPVTPEEPETPSSGQEEPEAPSAGEPQGNLIGPWNDIDPTDEYLLLVNKTHPVAASYVPSDLTKVKYYVKDREEITRYMRKTVTDAFHTLVEAAAKEGYTLVMTTAYRSYGVQKTLNDKYVANHGQALADQYSAKPGQSEHQTGLCTDVSSPTVQYKLVVKFGQTPEGKWLAEHAHEYGFILRFPEGKESITGYHYEPWHIRYVGQPAADRIYANNLTLEEYLGAVS